MRDSKRKVNGGRFIESQIYFGYKALVAAKLIALKFPQELKPKMLSKPTAEFADCTTSLGAP